jgi:MoxR-like ATPase
MNDRRMPIHQAIDSVGELRLRLKEQINAVVIGLDRELDLLLVALLSRGHVLLEGVPGVAKTLMARTFADSLGADFHRIQFTPDLLPSDVTGGAVFDRRTSEFVVKRGPIFTQILLADEINRSPAKTQSALLEAMQERQVTIEGQALALPDPFLVLATQNPVEEEGVYRLPEAQLDRFFLRVRFPYPRLEDEIRILKTHSRPVTAVEPLTTVEEIRRFQSAVEDLDLVDGIYRTVSEFARESRRHPAILLGLSPRASLSLLQAARARAVLGGRDYVIHEDVKDLLEPVLAHRLLLRPEAEMDGADPAGLLGEIFETLELWEDRQP